MAQGQIVFTTANLLNFLKHNHGMNNILTFYRNIDKIKHIERRGWKMIGVEGVRDTIASHSLGATLLGWIFAQRENLNQNKIIKLLLIHDLIMVHISDHLPQEGAYQSKRDQENIAAAELLKTIPSEIKEEFASLFQEYQRQQTEESQLAKECDKLDTLLQCTIYSERLNKNELKNFLTDDYKNKFNSKTGKAIIKELEEQSKNNEKRIPTLS